MNFDLPQNITVYVDDKLYRIAYEHGIDLTGGWVQKTKDEWMKIISNLDNVIANHTLYSRTKKSLGQYRNMILSALGCDVAAAVGFLQN